MLMLGERQGRKGCCVLGVKVKACKCSLRCRRAGNRHVRSSGWKGGGKGCSMNALILWKVGNGRGVPGSQGCELSSTLRKAGRNLLLERSPRAKGSRGVSKQRLCT